MLVQSKRNKRAALKLMRKLLSRRTEAEQDRSQTTLGRVTAGSKIERDLVESLSGTVARGALLL